MSTPAVEHPHQQQLTPADGKDDMVAGPHPIYVAQPQIPITAHYTACPTAVYGVQPTTLPAATEAGTYEVIPHRIFVGGFPPGTEESDLRSLFEAHGQVREVKVIRNTENGVSKGYGFVTFETDEEARAIRTSGEKLEIDGRRLNLGPAMRRIHHNQRYNDMIASPSPTMLLSGQNGQHATQFAYGQQQMQYVPIDMQQAVQAGYMFSQSPIGHTSSGVPYMMALPSQQHQSTINNTTYAPYPQQTYTNMSNVTGQQYVQQQTYPQSTTPQPMQQQYVMTSGVTSLAMTPSSQGATPQYPQGQQQQQVQQGVQQQQAQQQQVPQQQQASYASYNSMSLVGNDVNTIGRTPTRVAYSQAAGQRHSSNVRRSLHHGHHDGNDGGGGQKAWQRNDGGNYGAHNNAQYPSATHAYYGGKQSDEGNSARYTPSPQHGVQELTKGVDALTINH